MLKSRKVILISLSILAFLGGYRSPGLYQHEPPLWLSVIGLSMILGVFWTIKCLESNEPPSGNLSEMSWLEIFKIFSPIKWPSNFFLLMGVIVINDGISGVIFCAVNNMSISFTMMLSIVIGISCLVGRSIALRRKKN